MSRTVSVYDVSQVIGKDAAQSLVDAFPGATLYISTDPAALEFPSKVDRNEVILNMFYESGLSVKDIADRVHLSQRQVINIISENCKKR